MKNVITKTALITLLGITPFFSTPAFAQTAVTTPTPVPHYNQAVATWTVVAGSKCYNIYYRRVKQTAWKHSLRCVPNNMISYTIKGLCQGAMYEYTVSSLSYSGKETTWSPIQPLVATPIQ